MLWFTVLSFIIIVISIFLILIVLVQNSQGGGLAAGFTSSNQYMGVRKTTDFLEKATWTLGTALIVLSILSSIALHAGSESTRKSEIEQQVQDAQEQPASMPMLPGAKATQKQGTNTAKPLTAPAPEGKKK